MDPESKKFGRGPRELTSHFKLLPHHEFFCKWTLPISISDTRYLHNVVGDTKIRKGEGMQLDQLIQNASNSCMQQFELDVLRDAFQLNETTPIDLPPGEKGMPTVAGKFKSESKDKERKHKKHKEGDKENDKEHTKHKHHHKDKDQNNDKHKQKKKNRSGHLEFTAKQHEKKRKHDGDEDPNDVHRHRKSIRAQKWMKLVS